MTMAKATASQTNSIGINVNIGDTPPRITGMVITLLPYLVSRRRVSVHAFGRDFLALAAGGGTLEWLRRTTHRVVMAGSTLLVPSSTS